MALAGREEADVMECEEEEQRIYSKKTIFMYVIKNPLISSLNIISQMLEEENIDWQKYLN